jgi:predicted nucleic acid-binding protein
MMVICDTSVLCYLALIDCVAVLPRRFGTVTIPSEVAEECLHQCAPEKLRALLRIPPPWLLIAPASAARAPGTERLDPGEAAAISLAAERHAELLLIDERIGRQVASDTGLAVAWTLGILADAASRGWLSFDAAVERLLGDTNFYVSAEVIDRLRRTVGVGGPT